MTRFRLILRSLAHYWRTNAAVVAGVAAASAVLGGALVIGDSVRGTLRDLAEQRRGRADLVVAAPGWVREAMASTISGNADFRRAFSGLAPIVAVPGIVTDQTSGRRAGRVLVYGVDDRFWAFHGVGVSGPADREAFVSEALAREAGLSAGSFALVRVERPSAVPLESLHGRKTDVGRTLRLQVARVLTAREMGDFAIQPSQSDVLAAFVPLGRLQAELEVGGRVNTLLVSQHAATKPEINVIGYLLKDAIRAEDVGLRVRPLPERGAVSIESDAGLISPTQSIAIKNAFESTALERKPVLTYVANSIQIRDRTIPYSLVVAANGIAPVPPGIALNEWAARDLQAKVGDPVRLEYYVWEAGQLETRQAEFQLSSIVPVRPIDRDLVPLFKGISDSPSVESWDPPFPIDLRRVRRVDEDYWKQYRTTPKAYISLEAGQELWASRFGAETSVRFDVLAGKEIAATVEAFQSRLDDSIKPGDWGIRIADIRAASGAASQGATDFGEYFLYFSVFLVVSALALAALFFKLGVEQRVREVGLLRAVGVDAGVIKRGFLIEGTLIAVAGGSVGAAAALGYGWLVVAALRTIWVDAVGTSALSLHASPSSLIAGAVGGLAAAVVTIWWTLRGLAAISPRALLLQDLSPRSSRRARSFLGKSFFGKFFPKDLKKNSFVFFVSFVVKDLGWFLLAGLLAVLGAAHVIPREAAFFGAGVLVLAGGLVALAARYRARPRRVISGRGWCAMAALGWRNATERPGRSVLATGVMASAVFLLVSVDAFRREPRAETDRRSGTGGYSLVVESLLPIADDLNAPEARRQFNLAGLEGAPVSGFRVRPGDDASCLNLYVPQSPRILGVTAGFIGDGRFAFAESAAQSAEERANPWRLLTKNFGDGAIPAVADANSLTYVLKKRVGDDIAIVTGNRTVRLRIVAALDDSIFQRELLIGESQFQSLFPDRQGYQMWLVDAPADRAAGLRAEIENALSDHGADVTAAADRLAEFHRVENTYLSTFQMLGGLGLVLGTIGLGAVLLRNALERRRELALLRAVGYRRRHFVLMLAAESAALLVGGLAIGVVSAAIAVAPALAERGGRLPVSANALVLLVLVLASGMLTTLVAARATASAPLLASLRSE